MEIQIDHLKYTKMQEEKCESPQEVEMQQADLQESH